MCRISKAFAEKNAFIGYLTAGDGDSKKLFYDLLRGGVNLLEIGIPHSDPVADGPVIQRAMQRSLAVGTTPDSVLQLVKELRRKINTPMVLFTYYNPIQKDLRGFLKKAKDAGADGLLIVDLPFEESRAYRDACTEFGLEPIFVIAPSTPPERIREIAKMAGGFLYYACRKGTTGARKGLPEDLSEKLSLIRGISKLPIAVGFGVSERETAQEILQSADGFVVGSLFVDAVEKEKDLKEIAGGLKP